MWLNRIARLPHALIDHLSPLFHVSRTAGSTAPITVGQWIIQKLVGINRHAYWPVHFTSVVTGVSHIRIGVGAAPGASPGCYIQGANGIVIGDYTLVAPGVGLISSDHSIYNIFEHEPSGPIRIGKYCWIGMNAVILPDVVLGDHTVVAAGAVVNRSFEQGYCVIGGVPARLLKTIDRDRVVERKNEHEYLGFYSLERATREAIFRRIGVDLT